ncbi:MAG TPA: hypothetical protein VJ819_05035 [Nocardioidaceae bacterium]|nr:hypothetical protein [Nocardioidaceae bacterium]
MAPQPRHKEVHGAGLRPGRWAKARKFRLWALLAVVLLVVMGSAVVAGTADEEDPSGSPEASPSPSPSPTATPSTSGTPPYRAFHADSWWNAPLPEDAPTNPFGEEILDYLRTGAQSDAGCLTLAGAAGSRWGHPIYWAEPSDPEYDLDDVVDEDIPELDNLRIPEGALPADNGDGSMTVYDLAQGYVVALTDAEYDEDADTWSASGATVTYLDSNGLHEQTGRSDDPRNQGSHRGNNGATMAVPWEAVNAGEIRHVLKVASGPEVADRYVFPMVGSDGDYPGTDPKVPPQGLRLRIKPSVDLEDLDLDPQAFVIAQALQRYGFYIGDSGGTTSLKLENTVAEGRGQLWDLRPDALCGLPFSPSYWDVLAEGYDPSR